MRHISLFPGTFFGSIASLLSALFTVLFLGKLGLYMPISGYGLIFIGLLSALFGIVALVNKDWAIPVFYAVIVGIGIILFALCVFLFPR